MANKRLNAVITIGGTVAGALRNSLKSTTTRLTEVGGAIRTIKKRQDLLSKSIDTFGRQGKDVSRMREEYAKLSAEMERLRRRQLALKRVQDADLGGSFRRMRTEVTGLAVRAAALGGAAAGGIFALAKSTADSSVAAADHADKLGLSVERLQELRYAGEQAGVSSGKLDVALQRMTRRISDAARNGGSTAKVLEELGLSAGALASMTPDEALMHVADAMQQVTNQGDRVRLAFGLFDTEGVGLVNVLKNGSAGLREMAEEARATGNVLSEATIQDARAFSDQMTKATWAVSGLKNTLGAQLMPVVTQVLGRFNAYVRENRAQVEAFAARFAGVVERAIPAVLQLAESGVKFASVVIGITSAIAGLVGGFDNLATIAAVAFSAKAVWSVLAFGVAVGKAGAAVLSLVGGLPAVAAGIKAIGLALMANPIGLIVGGIAMSALLIWKYWEPIKGFMSSLWEGVKNVLAAAWDGIKTLFSWNPLGLIIKNWGGIADWFGSLWSGILEAARAPFDWIVGKLEWIGNAWSKVRSWFGGGSDSQAAQVPAQRAQPSPAAVTAPSLPNVAPAGGLSIGQVTLQVTAQPGEDEAALADRLWRLFQQRLEQERRSALYDVAGAY